MAQNTKYDGLEIAIIGMSGQFPDSQDCREFWENLKKGKSLIRTFTNEQLRETGVSESEIQNDFYIKSRVVLEKSKFDNAFFDYTAEEAMLMDPQIRLFHQHCWGALEDAGYAAETEKRKIGLFAGASDNSNWKLYVHGKAKNSMVDPFYLSTISDPKFITTLVSYKLNLRGPSIYVDTACSTSLTAIHLACRSLLTRDCTLALAGGISLNSIKKIGYSYEEGMIYSRDGFCRAFDLESTGTIRGEGVGVVTLKRLSEAIADGDHIYAIIRASAVNNDGNQKAGYTTPSVRGQAECIKITHKLAGIDPTTVSYVEGHGTGTKIGDPIEIRALNDAFGTGGGIKYCAIGTVKTNMGHLDTAAGVAGFIKTVLSLKNKQIPPSLHFKQPNPEIDFNNGPFYVNTDLKEWKIDGAYPLRAGVSSFGIGGTNAHILLEEAPEQEAGDSEQSYKILTLSAKTEDALIRYTNNLRNFVAEDPSINLNDMSYTLQVGRAHFAYRKFIVYKNRDSLLSFLSPEGISNRIIQNKSFRKEIVFMFPGQGSQYIGMGKDLYLHEQVFRTLLDSAFSTAKQIIGEDFKQFLFAEHNEQSAIYETYYNQLIIFVFQYALAQYLIMLDIKPDFMIGYSVGEYTAACLSGVVSFEDTLRLLMKRCELFSTMGEGAMIVVPFGPLEAQQYLTPNICMAAINGSEQVVLSGDVSAMASLKDKLTKRNINYLSLRMSRAAHSYMIDPIIGEFKKEFDHVSLSGELLIPFVSSLTGKIITREEAGSADYWARHMREPIEFASGIQTLLSLKRDLVFIEVGAGTSLSSILKSKQFVNNHVRCYNTIRPRHESINDSEYFINTLGGLWSNGIPINWTKYHAGKKRKRISMPTYSFEPVTYPTEVNSFEEETLIQSFSDNITKGELKDWVYYPNWKQVFLSPSGIKGNGKYYLFFSLNNALSGAVKNELLKQGSQFIEVLIGEYKELDNNTYVLNPLKADDFNTLIISLKDKKILIEDIIYEWGMSPDEFHKLKLTEDNLNLNLVFFSLIKLIQAALKNNYLNGKRLFTITNNLNSVFGNEKGAYVQSMLLSLINVLPQEHGITCSNIDVNLSPGQDINILSQDLVYELVNNRGKEDRLVALRNGHRWIPDYQKNSSIISIEHNVLKHGGLYVVTGGLGNVGFILCKYLIQKYNARIIILGRKEISDQDTSSKGGSRLTYLKSMGGEVKYFTIEITDYKKLSGIIHDVEKKSGKIQGLIHAAGDIDMNNFELIEDITFEKTQAVLKAKVIGIENIYKLFKKRNLDFVWITSSLASTLGGLSYSSYSAANLYMDHFISSKSGELSNWKCICLSEMNFDETDVAVKSDKKMLNPSDITNLFEWTLQMRNIPVVLQTVKDLHLRIQEVFIDKKEAYLNQEFTSISSGKIKRPEVLSSSYKAPQTQTEKKLVDILESILGTENVGMDDDFFELGGDSLKAMVLLKRIKKEFDINLSIKDFFAIKSIAKMASAITEMQLLLEKKDTSLRKTMKI